MIDEIADGGLAFYAGFTELLCMWFDERWHRCRDHSPEVLIKDGIISEAEYQIIDQFSEVFRKAYPKDRGELEQNLENLQNDPTWLKVVQAAQTAQSQLRALNRTEG